MSKSDRVIAGIFGVALLSAASLGHYHQVANDERANHATINAGEDERTVEAPSPEFNSEPVIVASDEESASADENLDRQQGNQQPWLWFGDGLAQWLMVVLGIAATALSAYAVILLKKTLAATSEAVRSADDAVTVTRKIGEAQVRAYLSLDIDAIDFRKVNNSDGSNLTIDITCTIRNTGQSPASNVCVLFDISEARPGDTVKAKADGSDFHNPGQSMTTIPAGKGVRKSLIRTAVADIDGLNTGTVRYRVSHVLNYIDVFGVDCRMPIVSFTIIPQPNGGYMLAGDKLEGHSYD